MSTFASGGRIVVDMLDLAARTCVPYRGDIPPLSGAELAALAKRVDGWTLAEEHHITKTFKFADFRQALSFVAEFVHLLAWWPR